MNWADLDDATKAEYIRMAGGDESAAAAMYANYLNGGAGAGLPNGSAMATSEPATSYNPPPSPSAALHTDETVPAGGSMGGNALQSAPPPVSMPPDPTGTGGSGGSSSYTSGGGGGGSYQSTPSSQAVASAPRQSDWSAALHASGALQDPRANPIPFGSAPGAASGMFDPYMRNTQGSSGGTPAVGGGVPSVSAPPDPTMGAAPAGMTNFNPGAQPRTDVGVQDPPMGNTAGAPAPAPVAAPPAAPQISGAQMTPEEIRLRYGMLNKQMSQNYGAY